MTVCCMGRWLARLLPKSLVTPLRMNVKPGGKQAVLITGHCLEWLIAEDGAT